MRLVISVYTVNVSNFESITHKWCTNQQKQYTSIKVSVTNTSVFILIAAMLCEFTLACL
jgi:hypothetical protein